MQCLLHLCIFYVVSASFCLMDCSLWKFAGLQCWTISMVVHRDHQRAFHVGREICMKGFADLSDSVGSLWVVAVPLMVRQFLSETLTRVFGFPLPLIRLGVLAGYREGYAVCPNPFPLAVLISVRLPGDYLLCISYCMLQGILCIEYCTVIYAGGGYFVLLIYVLGWLISCCKTRRLGLGDLGQADTTVICTDTEC